MPHPTPHTEPLHLIRDHLLVRRGEAFDLLDTGVPITMRAPSIVSDELGVRVERLIGCAELARTPVTVDWPARTITWGATRRDRHGVKVPLRMSPLGVPLIPLDTETGCAEAVLDTGAALSYCPPEYVYGLRPVRHDEDFLPGFGRFAVEVHKVEIEVMGVSLTLEVAVLPPLLRAALAMIAPDGWILGAALFRARVVTLDLARSLAIVGEHHAMDATASGPREHASGGTSLPADGAAFDDLFDDMFDDAEEHDDIPDAATPPCNASARDDLAGIACTVAFDTTTLRTGDTRIRAAVTLRGTGAGEGERPVDLTLVLDRSGSMAGEPIEAVRDAASALVARLPQGSRAAIVTFDSEVRVDFALAPIGDGTLLTCQRAIRAIDTGGTTALADGWRRGRSVLTQAPDESAGVGQVMPLRRIVLMTDGHANVGETSPTALAAMCRNAAQRGISTTTMGFGDGYDEDLLRAMADAGDGNTWYMQGPDRVAEVLVEELRAMRSVSALRVALGVAPDAPLTGVWGGLTGGGRVDADDASRGHSIMVGELSAVAERTVVLEFTLPRGSAGAPLQLAACEATGVAPDGVTPVALRFAIAWDWVRRPNSAVRATWLELRVAAMRERAIALADARRFDAAAQLLQRGLALLDRQPAVVRDLVRGSREQLAALLHRMRERRLDTVDRKRSLQHAYDRRTGKQTLFNW
ncbi:MAG: VWA domain-containing protein [Gemmatimonadaceae bacterium]|nr:VWA domain-containing protein [Gemmatimonadaceae bacterium]